MRDDVQDTSHGSPAASHPPRLIEDALYGFMVSQLLFTGDELGVFDALVREGKLTAAQLAASIAVEPGPLERLLLAGVACGLVGREGESYFVPAELSPYLSRASEAYCGGRFPHFREITTRIFPYLTDAIREGAPQWHRLFPGSSYQSPFEKIYRDSEATENFLSSMWGLGYDAAKELMSQFPLADFKRLVDVGGASGSFAVAALQSNPHLQAVVFDLPPVSSYLERKAEEFGLEGRLTFEAGDFFRDELPEADVYALGYVLSDWSRADGSALLCKIHRALPSGGAVLVLEKLFSEDKTGPLATAMMNLTMLLETYGQHYSASEYEGWLTEAGFVGCRVIHSSGEKHMIVGYKP